MSLLGPWLYKEHSEAQIPVAYWNTISDYLMGRLWDTIKGLAQGANRLPNFHVVTTQGTLKRTEVGGVQESNDWLNEIHPSSDGYKKIATKITSRLRKVLA